MLQTALFLLVKPSTRYVSQNAILKVCVTTEILCLFQYLQAVYTLHMDEVRAPHQVPIILNRSLGELLPLVHQEVVLAFEETFPLEGDGERCPFQSSASHSQHMTHRLEILYDFAANNEHHWEN